ncbi:GntR family transcriptional regulator [Lentilitoribacter sp. Alg239-R112]|uniref:GntR family transcriptional regulator n=1 Tax=Lentilitoribacter sp. Alg239-R112 TaxID=2305987 RepID=UPI0013A6AE62|nr:GntR family transcriptional regulator [Lentilitoribacter sp. Alg239-R112]
MSRAKNLYKECYNELLSAIAELDCGANLPSETQLSKDLRISRTTIRSVLEQLHDAKIINWDGRKKTILRKPLKRDHFPIEETRASSEKVEIAFIEYVLNGDLKPGAIIRESDLVREIGVSASVIREYLIRFSRFGLIEKEPNRHWILRGFTRAYANELSDVREMFEFSAFRKLCADVLSDEDRQLLLNVKAEHVRYIQSGEVSTTEFGQLDERMHSLITRKLGNRFVDDFYQIVAVIFHYHYRWNKSQEVERNLAALAEHLAIIDALLEGDNTRALREFEIHLASARRTLNESVIWDNE